MDIFEAWLLDSNRQMKMTKFCVRMIEEKEDLLMPNIKQAIYLIKEAWDKVSAETISNCWKHAGNKK